MSRSRLMTTARLAKNDEFYTQMSTIEKEVVHYKEHFKNKVVYCNCDDFRESNFFDYFVNNFEILGLKKLIASCYKSREVTLFDTKNKNKAFWVEYLGKQVNNSLLGAESINVNYFEGDGDFRSGECVELLNQADIVVTNPPFSLFREYIAQLIEYDKKFLVLGNLNAISTKDIFPLIKNDKMWAGHSFNKFVKFRTPSHYNSNMRTEDENYVKVPAICWYTNINYSGRFKCLVLDKKYMGNEEKYPKFDNFDAINVDFVKDIPTDFKGKMGVPITFIGNYNPKHFKIIGLDRYVAPKGVLSGGRFTVNGKSKYARILIQNKYLNKFIHS